MIKLLIFDFCGTLASCGMADYGRIAQKLREFNLAVSDNDILKLGAALPGFLIDSQNWDELTDKAIQKLGLVLERDRREQLAVFLENGYRVNFTATPKTFLICRKKGDPHLKQ